MTTDPVINAARTEAERVRRDAKYLTPAQRGPLLEAAAAAEVRKALADAWDEGNIAGCDRSENHDNPYRTEGTEEEQP